MYKSYKSPIKTGWQDVPFPRSLAEAFKNNIYYDSLLLLFDGLGKEKGQIYGLGRQTSFIYRGKKSETSGDSLYHLIIYSAHSQWNLLLKKSVHKECKGAIYFHEKYANASNSSTPYLARLHISDLQFSSY